MQDARLPSYPVKPDEVVASWKPAHRVANLVVRWLHVVAGMAWITAHSISSISIQLEAPPAAGRGRRLASMAVAFITW
jgi:hypothetical protein